MCYSDLTKETYLILVQDSGSSIPLPEDFAGVRAHYICAPAKACKFSARSVPCHSLPAAVAIAQRRGERDLCKFSCCRRRRRRCPRAL